MASRIRKLGKIDPGFLPHCWFGRPLIISDASKCHSDRLIHRIENDLKKGCDGIAISVPPRPDEWATFERICQASSSKAFICIYADSSQPVAELVALVKPLMFSRGYVLVSRQPALLTEFYRALDDPSLALRISSEKEVVGLDQCPHTGVVLAESVASHVRICRIHNSGKSVLVQVGGISTDDAEIIKRHRWLVHERVDAIVTTDVVCGLQAVS